MGTEGLRSSLLLRAINFPTLLSAPLPLRPPQYFNMEKRPFAPLLFQMVDKDGDSELDYGAFLALLGSRRARTISLSSRV